MATLARYCEMCDEWFYRYECPKCGMKTIPAQKADTKR
jgi:predicted RNA-binding Zn-ribbon protein involved in translation (DUF1610 family)